MDHRFRAYDRTAIADGVALGTSERGLESRIGSDGFAKSGRLMPGPDVFYFADAVMRAEGIDPKGYYEHRWTQCRLLSALRR
jgi:hypothetical protein